MPGSRTDEEHTQYESVCQTIKNILGDEIDKVVVSNRIAESPCCIVTSQYGHSANMERILKAQALRDSHSMMMMGGKKILEINPEHEIIRGFAQADMPTKDIIWMLYETALLTSGYTLSKPTSFASRIHKLLALGMDGVSTEEASMEVNLDEQGPNEEVGDGETGADGMEQVD